MMVKKGQTRGVKAGGAGKTKEASLSTSGEDSFIVFTNSNKDPKSKKLSERSGTADKALPGGLDGPALAGEAPKRPDVKKIIGGASWTGKLPVNILSEHCQKQNWEKPEYRMTKAPEGFSSMVILKAKNPKTQELVQLPPFKLPPSHKYLAEKPTALEARHFAATYALFRVCSMRNIHMMLPSDYRNLWKGEFEALKKEDIQGGHAWMYEADPFTTLRERTAAKAASEKKRIELGKLKEQASITPWDSGMTLNLDYGQNIPRCDGRIQRGWDKAPKIDMGKRTRATVEGLIHRYAIWNPHSVRIPESQSQSIVNEFINLGFRQSHIEEAIDECKDREEALEWLLIHVPEDDLPRWALPEGYVAGISMASNDLKKEAAINRLAESGYSLDLCREVLDTHKGDETRAAETLQEILMASGQVGNENSAVRTFTPADGYNQSCEIWREELSSLESVFGENYIQVSPDICRIHVRPESPDSSPSVDVNIQIRRSSNYPETVPVISVLVQLPAYIRLSIVKRALNHATESLLGGQMVFFLVQWIEENFCHIVQKPGKLRDIFAAASIVNELHVRRQPKSKPHSRRATKISWIANPKSTEEWRKRQADPLLQSRLLQRKSLPSWKMRETLIDTVNSHQVTIISGETGSGKSTQSAQFILDDFYSKGLGENINIICTQPRRISALSLADRVSEERCSALGQEVGYIIRGESKTTPKTKITFVTTGVLLRRLQMSGGSEGDVMASLADISHIIIDEVHERSLDSDFLLALLREVLWKRRDLKLILMSATLDSSIFEEYFRGGGIIGRVEISGRAFPVEDYYLDDVIRMTGFHYRSSNKGDIDHNADSSEAGGSGFPERTQNIEMRINYELIAQTIKEIDAELSRAGNEGGILVFLSGVAEINKALDHLRSIPNLHALPLHASLQPTEQRRVFPHARPGFRKVVVATNVAETSITIDDIVAVVDSGRVKEMSYDPQNNMQKISELWASRAAGKQRRGRAGRTQAGKCYKLFTRETELLRMAERPEPEIRRVPLEQLCLSVRAMGIRNIHQFLESVLTPPDSLVIDGALELLTRMGALDGDDLTALGYHLSMMPADLRCGKLMVYGAMFGCLDACVVMAAILTIKSPFITPQDKRDEAKAARSRFACGHGDLIGNMRAFERWDSMVGSGSVDQKEIRNWCFENFLSYQILNDIASNKTQYLASLREIGFITKRSDPSLNRNASNTALLRSLIAGALNPQLARINFPDKKFVQSISGAVELDPEARTIKYFNQENGRIFVHPSSTLFDAQTFPGNAAYISYFNKIETSKIFIRDLTPFNAYTALLFSGPISLDTLGRGLTVDGWLRMRGWARIGVLVSRLRSILDDVLAKKIDEPEIDLCGNEVVAAVIRLVELDGMDQ